jgi:hypothetical protein
MSGDVITTIREYVWILGLIGFILSVFLPSGWGTRGITRTFALSRTRKLRQLQERRARLQLLHGSDREYYGWLLYGVLGPLALLALSMAGGGLIPLLSMGPMSSLNLVLADLVNITRGISAMGAYLLAIKHCQDYQLLQHFDHTMAYLDQAIAKLEAKQGSRQPVAAA